MDLRDSKVLALLEKTLDFTLERQGLISSNLANVHTPGYRGKDLSFENQLRKAAGAGASLPLKTTSVLHVGSVPAISEVTAEVVVPAGTIIKNDLNSVDMEKELMKLGRNAMLYNMLVQAMNKKLRLMETTIREAGK